MSIGSRDVSLTRQLRLESYRQAAAKAKAGMSEGQARTLLEEEGADQARVKELFSFDADGLVEDEVVRLCRNGDPATAVMLIFFTRIWTDHRLATLFETRLTDASGKLRLDRLNRQTVQRLLGEFVSNIGPKEASNVLGYMVQAHVIDPEKNGSEIIGVKAQLPTAAVVPSVVQFVHERIRSLDIRPPADADPVDLALGLGVNHWINLTPDEFRRAAHPEPEAPAPVQRTSMPAELALVDEELRRRRQVVLQGAPGVGKTHVAMHYVDWASGAAGREASHLSSLLALLPSHERTPARVADLVIARGLAAVWDIVQFHPSYGYEDFVRTLAPRPGEGGMTFVPEHRPFSFLAAVGVALLARGSRADVILVVDEVNRADISRVFGELLYGLEYRGQPVATPHVVDGSNSMTVPINLLLLATMNTADRSIALIDYALRRRFTFLSLAPDREVVAEASWKGQGDRQAALALYDLVADLFKSPDPSVNALAIGHSYFLPVAATTEAESMVGLSHRFAFEVYPLLQEYAAEGLVDATRLATLTAALGLPEGARGQKDVAAAALGWLGKQTADGD